MEPTQNVIKQRQNWLNWLLILTFSLFYIVKLSGSLLPISLYLITATVIFSALFNFFVYPLKHIYVSPRVVILSVVFIYMPFTLLWTRAFGYGFQKLWILFSLVFVAFLVRRAIVTYTRQYTLVFTIMFLSVLVNYVLTYGLWGLGTASLKRFNLVEGLNPIGVGVFLCIGIINLIFYLIFYHPPLYKKIIVFCGIGLAFFLFGLDGVKRPDIQFNYCFIFTYAYKPKV